MNDVATGDPHVDMKTTTRLSIPRLTVITARSGRVFLHALVALAAIRGVAPVRAEEQAELTLSSPRDDAANAKKMELAVYPSSAELHLRRIYGDAKKEFAFRTGYPGGFNQWQVEARARLRQLLGLDRIAKEANGHLPCVTLKEVGKREWGVLYEGNLESEPNITFPFWLLKPSGDGPFPLAVFPHGHDKRGRDTSAGIFHDEAHKHKSISQDRDVAVQAVKQGFVSIAPAVRGLASEASGIPDVRNRHGGKDCRSHAIHCLLVGRTAIGERVWDIEKLVDYGSSLPYVDSRRVLAMGNSAGGVVVLYAAACDERITVAIASCSFSVLVNEEGHISYCDCDLVPDILDFGEMYDIAGLIAPRHLLVVNGAKDPLFDAADVEHAAAKVATVYSAAKMPSHFELRWGPAGHRFYADLMWPFIAQAINETGTK